MNKKKTQRAARLYALATIAWMDAGGAESDEEADVVSVAIERARTELERIAPGARPCRAWPQSSTS